ncbi:uncharacterized protein LOC122022844 [Zingiber officinale]|uniref:uncharacterized protein LOC122022844 n=1 Tax=Zingiber officinale TaxID=94328 RepID=UPI001C4B0341|nr:uncharacterized protein LOC122022844 [Zingiber officinale]
MADLARLSFLLLLSISSLLSVSGLEFHVGGPRGWVIPAAVEEPEYYNRWAMRERFHVGDSLFYHQLEYDLRERDLAIHLRDPNDLYFKYKNDSVAVVNREAYGELKAEVNFFIQIFFPIPIHYQFEYYLIGKGKTSPASSHRSKRFHRLICIFFFVVLDFKYKNDSVAVVDREAYGKCSAADPLVFFDNGNTTFRFDRYGFFYFISGSQGHCEAGQRLIVRVMVHPATSTSSGSPAPAPANRGSSGSRSGSDSGFDSGPAKSGSPLAIHAGLGMGMGTLLTAALLV